MIRSKYFSKKKFGRRLHDIRSSHGETQADLAKAIDVSQQAVHLWERGSSAPSLDTVFDIAEHYGVTLDYLTGRTESNVHKYTTQEMETEAVQRFLQSKQGKQEIWLIYSLIQEHEFDIEREQWNKENGGFQFVDSSINNDTSEGTGAV